MKNNITHQLCTSIQYDIYEKTLQTYLTRFEIGQTYLSQVQTISVVLIFISIKE